MLGTSGSGFGMGEGTFGFSKKQSDMTGIVAGLNDVTQQAVLAPIVQTWPTPALTNTVYGTHLTAFFSGLDRVGAAANSLSATIRNFDTLQAWYNYTNASSYWQCLNHPDYRLLYSATHNGAFPNHLNVYFTVLAAGSYGGVTFTNALGKLVVPGPTTTLGYTVDPTKYVGGPAYWTWTGGTGSGTVTVTGLDQNGSAETWTVSQSGASGSTVMTPSGHTYSLITKVNTIVAAGGVTATTGYVESHTPAGRSNPPS